MLKYKDKYVFCYSRDVNGKIYNNDDNMILCRNDGQIYRYNDDTLVFVSPSRVRLKKVNTETGEVEYDYENLVLDIYDTDAERVITFKEENFNKLKKVLKVRSKRKLTEEQKEAARIRLAEWRKNNQQNDSQEYLEDDYDIKDE
jgi:hypothetical protein